MFSSPLTRGWWGFIVDLWGFSHCLFIFWRFIMRPLSRKHVSKYKSARKFRAHGSRTKAANLAMPMRGGIRL